MSFQIPDSAYPRCLVCGQLVKTQSGILHEVTGFERGRSRGGANHIVARTRTGRIVGDCCALKVQAKVVDQESLL